VILYTRAGCHLCEEAEHVLDEQGIVFTRVDIERDDALFKRYLERIPVVAVGDEEVCELEVDVVALRNKLRQR
jgi:glutaredoxin